jgi:hypothetical protein
MEHITPKQALAAREAHLGLVELKRLIEEAASSTHTAELECFRAALTQGEGQTARYTLQRVVEKLRAADFDAKLSVVRENLQLAASA